MLIYFYVFRKGTSLTITNHHNLPAQFPADEINVAMSVDQVSWDEYQNLFTTTISAILLNLEA